MTSFLFTYADRVRERQAGEDEEEEQEQEEDWLAADHDEPSMFDSPTALGPEESELEPAPEPESEPEPAPGMALEIAEGGDEEEFSDRCARIPCVPNSSARLHSRRLLVAASGTRRVLGTR